MSKEELKTLKDINEDFLQNKGYDILSPTAIKLLKQEAIKRVKSCCPNDNIGGIPLRKNKRCSACERDIWFYGLTDEDLI